MVQGSSAGVGVRLGQGILASGKPNPDKRHPERLRLPKALVYLSWICIAMGIPLLIWFFVDQVPGEPVSRSLVLAPMVGLPLIAGIFGLISYSNWYIVLGHESLAWRNRRGREYSLKFSEITRAKVDSPRLPQSVKVWGANGQKISISVVYFRPVTLLNYLAQNSLITLADPIEGGSDPKMDFLQKNAPEGFELITPYDRFLHGVPVKWDEILRLEQPERVAATINMWESGIGARMAQTVEHMRTHLQDVELIRMDGELALLYSFRGERPGEEIYYVGGNPDVQDFGDNTILASQWHRAPHSLAEFYSQLHNGFGNFERYHEGPSRLLMVLQLEDIASAVRDGPTSADFNIATTFKFSTNNYGHGVALDFENPDENQAIYLWEESPDRKRYGNNFWAEVDKHIVDHLRGEV